jgi:hypothetical protein
MEEVHMVHRRLTLAVAGGTLMALLLGSVASAGTPPSGQGLATLAIEGITSLGCSDPSIAVDDVVVTRGGGTATWTVDGRMYLLQSIDVSLIITTPDGSFPDSFSKTWGNKAGLTEMITCDFEQHFSQGDVSVDGSGTATLVLIR